MPYIALFPEEVKEAFNVGEALRQESRKHASLLETAITINSFITDKLGCDPKPQDVYDFVRDGGLDCIDEVVKGTLQTDHDRIFRTLVPKVIGVALYDKTDDNTLYQLQIEEPPEVYKKSIRSITKSPQYNRRPKVADEVQKKTKEAPQIEPTLDELAKGHDFYESDALRALDSILSHSTDERRTITTAANYFKNEIEEMGSISLPGITPSTYPYLQSALAKNGLEITTAKYDSRERLFIPITP